VSKCDKNISPKFGMFFQLATKKNLRLKFLLNFAKKTPKKLIVENLRIIINKTKHSTKGREREKGTRWEGPKYLQNKVHYK
jgi:hypothetical protein